jgi:hypothetical protein
MSRRSAIEWPPLICGAKVPIRVRLRDLLLTVLAWALMGYLMRDTLRLTYDFLRPPPFEFTNLSPPAWLELWGRLQPFAHFVAVLVLRLLFSARMDGRRMRATASLPQAVPLSLAAQAAAACRLDATTLAAWREARMLVVQFDAEGRVTHGELKLLGSSRADDACHPGLPTAGAGS